MKDFTYTVNLVGATNENKFLKFSNNEFTGQNYYDLANMESPNQPGKLQRIEEGQRWVIITPGSMPVSMPMATG